MRLKADQYDELCRLILEIEESGYEFNERAAEFLQETRRRIETYGNRIVFSDAQWEWLRNLHGKATQ